MISKWVYEVSKDLTSYNDFRTKTGRREERKCKINPLQDEPLLVDSDGHR